MEKTISYYATVLYKEFNAYTARRLQKWGLNFGSVFFVIYVGKHPGCTPAELTAALHLDWGYSQRSVTRLIENGLLEKVRSMKDGRSSHLNLTEKGQQAFLESHQVFWDWDQEKLGSLSAKEKTQLQQLLQKVVERKGDVNV